MFRLQVFDPTVDSTDQLMMEFELCVGLVFKPLRHHLKNIVDGGSAGSVPSIWLSILVVLEDLFSDKMRDTASQNQDTLQVIPDALKATMNSLANEHLQNAVMVLLSVGLLDADDSKIAPGDVTTKTWELLHRMGLKDSDVQRWKQQVSSGCDGDANDHAEQTPQL
jgi:hypothetical protein